MAKGGGLACFNWSSRGSSFSPQSSASTLSGMLNFFSSSTTSSHTNGDNMKSSTLMNPAHGVSTTNSSASSKQSDLASSSFFSSNTGSNANIATSLNVPSTLSVPSDAELVMHLVCRFLDEQMPGDISNLNGGNVTNRVGGTVFTEKWFVPYDKQPGLLVATCVIF